MRSVKLFLGVTVFSLLSFTASSSIPTSTFSITPSASTDAVPSVSKKQQQLLLMKWFVKLSPKEYGKMRGKKLNFFEKLSFKLTQYRMKQQLKANNTGDSEGVNWAGLALGAFLGFFGVVGAYVFSKDKNFIKWAWIGCGIWIVVALLLFF